MRVQGGAITGRRGHLDAVAHLEVTERDENDLDIGAQELVHHVQEQLVARPDLLAPLPHGPGAVHRHDGDLFGIGLVLVLGIQVHTLHGPTQVGARA